MKHAAQRVEMYACTPLRSALNAHLRGLIGSLVGTSIAPLNVSTISLNSSAANSPNNRHLNEREAFT